MNNDTAALLATATAKSAAHSGLTDALEYGQVVSFIRVNGTPRLVVSNDLGERFVVTFDNNDGTAHCNGYRLGSTAALLAGGHFDRFLARSRG